MTERAGDCVRGHEKASECEIARVRGKERESARESARESGVENSASKQQVSERERDSGRVFVC